MLAITPGNPTAHLAHTTVRNQNAGQDFDRGGLTRTVRSDIAHQLAGGHLERDAPQRVDAAVLTGKEPCEGTHQSRPPHRNPKRLGEILYDNLGHCSVPKEEARAPEPAGPKGARLY